MIGQYAVVGECDILLLPLFVERVPTALQQDALMEVTKPESENLFSKVSSVPLPDFSNMMTAGCQKHPLHHPSSGFVRSTWEIAPHHSA